MRSIFINTILISSLVVLLLNGKLEFFTDLSADSIYGGCDSEDV